MAKAVRLGLRQNAFQFSILVLVNAFVGAMVGLERSILPELAESEFGINAKTAILSFIIVFGLVKALANYYAGSLANAWGRKNILLLGWIAAIPVPLILIFTNSWNWIIAANIFLGINQGLAWSSTVVMKIDLVGPKNRGLAMGLNEFAGYLAVGIMAFLTGYIAGEYGLKPYPFYLGIFIVIAGLLISYFVVEDTVAHASQEARNQANPRLTHVFFDTSFRNPNLGSITQAGLVNNLNDGMVWGILPILLASLNFKLEQIGVITAIYPAVWGIGQLISGRLADLYSKKKILIVGMLIQGAALLGFSYAITYLHFIGLSIALGAGTALVYPTFLAAIADFTHPVDRAKSVGVFRLWRDSGYAIGAVLTGFVADRYSVNAAILLISCLTVLSAIIIAVRMKKNSKMI